MWFIDTKKSNESDIIREHLQHLTRLQMIKPRVDTNPPKSLAVYRKPKKNHTQSNANFSVQLENQILLKKMYDIDARPHKFSKTKKRLKKSLNRSIRIKNLSKITEENQSILNRIERTKSSYSVKELERDHQFKVYLKHKIAENSRHVPRVALPSSVGVSLTTTPFSRPTTVEMNARPQTGSKLSKQLL